MSARAVFFDRDGTLNVEKNYLHRPEEWEWVPGVLEGLRIARAAGFRLVVVTNQSGIGRGYYTEADVRALHTWVQKELRSKNLSIDGYYFCPHGEKEGCACRKPRPGMILQACRDLGIDPQKSYLVGDRTTDLEAARAAGVRPIFVLTGYGMNEKDRVGVGVPVMADALAAVRWINEQEEHAQ